MPRGCHRPRSYDEFTKLQGSHAADLQETCVLCGLKFGPTNTRTAAGWMETQISGYCEACFDRLFADDDDVSMEGQDD